MFGFDQQEERDMLRMVLRPCSNFFKTIGKQKTRAPLIKIRYMDNFESGFIHLAIWIKISVRRKSCMFRQCSDLWMCEPATMGILDNVDFQLPDAAVQLRSESCVPILQSFGFVRILARRKFFLARCKSKVIAVMGSDYLNLV